MMLMIEMFIIFKLNIYKLELGQFAHWTSAASELNWMSKFANADVGKN